MSVFFALMGLNFSLLLGDQEFTAKSFRRTEATIAMSQGILPETVMKLGRWKTKEVFLNHCVYGQVPSGFTTSLLSKDL